MIKFGSVCSGIEAASVAWNPLGWSASWLAEIEPFPVEVLKYHYPDTPNYGDMEKLEEMVLEKAVEAPDVLVGGTPCQSFSVAGMRAGLTDDRGQLTIKYVELANAIDTIRRRDGKDESIIVWENVPGVLSSKDNAFGCFIAALAGEDEEIKLSGKRWTNAGVVSGPQRTVAWRVLDAQYFGLAQRRKRVFVVASAREGFCPAEVLFEFDGVRRDTAPSRETRKEAAGNAGESFGDGQVAGALAANPGMKQTTYLAFNSRQDPVSGDVFGALDTCSTQAQAIAIQGTVIGRKPENGPQGSGWDGTGVCFTQTAVDRHAVATPFAVRRLTPVECERLQGFPDNYTQIPWRDKPSEQCPDGHRYKALGNSMAVPVMRWIGQRIDNQIAQNKKRRLESWCI